MPSTSTTGLLRSHDGEGQQHPGQVGSREGEEAQEAEGDIGVPSAPHIHLAVTQQACWQLD